LIMPKTLEVALVVEDALSLVVMAKLLAHTGRGYTVTRQLVERGFGNIRRSVAKYRTASHVLPHVVLTDLDQAVCPPFLREQWGVATLPNSMLFRVAIREVEAWLLADRVGFSDFAGIPQNKISQAPESLVDPKQTLLNLVRRSRNRRLAIELIPSQGSRVSIGPLYNERLSTYVRENWDVDAAMALAPSLKRTVDRLHTFLK
jgi:hypothetical protein